MEGEACPPNRGPRLPNFQKCFVMQRFLRFLAATMVFGLLASAAYAADVGETLQGLGAKASADKIAAIDALAASGDPRALDILQAMLDGRLYRVKADDSIVFADKIDDVLVTASLTEGPKVVRPTGCGYRKRKAKKRKKRRKTVKKKR